MHAEIPDDVIRAKASNTSVPQPQVNIYTNQPTIVNVSPRFKLIQDPIAYEMEYKKRNVWSIKDLRTFIVFLLKYCKNMEKIGEALPHKSSKEIVFFYHTFKKLIGLKKIIKESRELQAMKQMRGDMTYAKQADELLQPLFDHQKKLKIEVEPEF